MSWTLAEVEGLCLAGILQSRADFVNRLSARIWAAVAPKTLANLYGVEVGVAEMAAAKEAAQLVGYRAVIALAGRAGR